MKLLLTHGATPESTGVHNELFCDNMKCLLRIYGVRSCSALLIAVAHKRGKAAKVLSDAGAKLEAPLRPHFGRIRTSTTMLHMAIGSRIEGLQSILDLKPNLDANGSGNTTLHFAIRTATREKDTYNWEEQFGLGAIKDLIKHGADVSAADVKGWTPLHHAVGSGLEGSTFRIAIIEILFTNGADPNARTLRRRMIPLHFAAMSGRNDVLALLVKHGGDMKAKDSRGRDVQAVVKIGSEPYR